MRQIPFWSRLSTRLTLLILVIVAVLAGATAIMVTRGFNQAQRGAAVLFEQGSGDGGNLEETPDPNAVIRATLINLVAVFLFTLIGAAVFSRNLLIEPITSLVRGTRELASGNLGVTLPVTSNSELGVLAEAFNQMSLALAERTRELLDSNEALRVSEERYELAVRGANDGLWDWDMTRERLYLSPRWKAMLGYRDEELASSLESWQALTHPSDKPVMMEALEACRNGVSESFQIEHRLKHKGGHYLWMLVRGTALRDEEGRALRMAGSITDISDRVRALELLEKRVQERTRDLTALLELSNSTALTLELHPLLEKILDRLQDAVGFTSATVLEIASDGVLKRVAARGASLQLDEDVVRQVLANRTPRLEDDPPTRLILPLIVRDAPVGALFLQPAEGEEFGDDRMRLAGAFASQVGVALENAKLYERVQEKAAFEERQHLARELHDSVSQALYAILLGTHTARRKLEAAPEQAGEALSYVENLAQAGIAEMRALIFELRPESLEKEGLTGALRKQLDALEARHALETSFQLGAEPELPFAAKQVLYRVGQEALHNVVKHARATKVRLALWEEAGRVKLEVMDDGVGFDPSETFPGHLGIRSMRERVAALGGTLTLQSDVGKGTRVTASIPGEPRTPA